MGPNKPAKRKEEKPKAARETLVAKRRREDKEATAAGKRASGKVKEEKPKKSRETLVSKRRREDKKIDAAASSPRVATMGPSDGTSTNVPNGALVAKRKAAKAPAKSSQTFGQAFKEARAKAKKAGDAGGGKFKWTNAKGVTDTFNTITDDDNKAAATLAAKKKLSAPSEKGFFGKLGDRFKKATTTTPGRPRKPSGKKPMRTPSTGPWAEYENAMKDFKSKPTGKKAGGSVRKPVKKSKSRTSVKKKSPRRP